MESSSSVPTSQQIYVSSNTTFFQVINDVLLTYQICVILIKKTHKECMVMKKYSIEIMQPNETSGDIICHIDSNEQFLTINKGDIINPRAWDSHYLDLLRSSVGHDTINYLLRVTGIEHMIFFEESKGFNCHKIRIYTESLPDCNHRFTFQPKSGGFFSAFSGV